MRSSDPCGASSNWSTSTNYSPGLPNSEPTGRVVRSEEHTSELQSLMRISYAVFCLKKKKKTNNTTQTMYTDYQITIINTHSINKQQDEQINKPHKHYHTNH